MSTITAYSPLIVAPRLEVAGLGPSGFDRDAVIESLQRAIPASAAEAGIEVSDVFGFVLATELPEYLVPTPEGEVDPLDSVSIVSVGVIWVTTEAIAPVEQAFVSVDQAIAWLLDFAAQ